jgi:hypothetical protein
VSGEPVSLTASVPLDGSGKEVPAGGSGDAGGNGAPAAGAPSQPAAGVPAGDGNSEAGKPAAGTEAPVNPETLNQKPAEGEKPAEQVRAEAATGLDLTPFAREFNTSGKLSDESYAKLAEKGFTREIADTYIAGVQARAAAHHTALSQAVGGVDSWNAIMTWGKDNLSDAEKAETVRALSNTNNVDAAKTYLLGLQARFVAANGKVPGKIAGGGAAPQGDVFTSRQEQAKAMKDPRYKTDAAYRNEVAQKSIRSFGKGTKARAKTTTRRAPKGKR